MKKIFITSILIFIFSSIFAFEYKPYPFSNTNNTNLTMPSLINFDKLDVSHSASFTAGGNNSGNGFYQSKYTNHLTYNFAKNLTFKVDLNVVNFGTASFNKEWDIEGNNDNESKVLPDFSLEFRPSENTLFLIEVNTSGSNYYNNRWGVRHW